MKEGSQLSVEDHVANKVSKYYRDGGEMRMLCPYTASIYV